MEYFDIEIPIEEGPQIFDIEIPFEEAPKLPAIAEAEEAVSLAEKVRRGEIFLSELPPDVQERLGYITPGEVGPLGMMVPGEEPMEVAPPEVRETLLKSPKILAALEGVGAAVGPLVGIKEEERTPTVEEVYGRPKTRGEWWSGLGGRMAAELPMIMGAELTAGSIIPRTITEIAGHRAALNIMRAGTRSGIAGGGFHAVNNFAEQMLDPTESFDWSELGKDVAEGFGWWFLFGAGGKALGEAWGRYALKEGKRLAGWEKLTAEANREGLVLTRATDDAILKEYGRPMLEITGPDGFRKVLGSSKIARQFLKNVRKNEAMAEIGPEMWEAFWDKMNSAWDVTEAKYLLDPKEIGSVNAGLFGKIVGNLPSLFQKMENAVFGPRAILKMKRAAAEIGVPTAEIPAWIRSRLEILEPFKLFTTFFDPAQNAERRSRNTTTGLLNKIYREVVKPIKQEAKESGKSQDQIASRIYRWLIASGRRDVTNPNIVVNSIHRWRRILDQKGIEGAPLIRDQITKFVKKRNWPSETVAGLEELVLGKSKNLAIGPMAIERRFGDALRAAPSEPAKGRLPAGEGKEYRRLKKILADAPAEERALIEAEMGVPLRRVEEVEAAYKMTTREIEVAKRARKLFDSMFNMAGLDAATYLKWYAPLRSEKTLTMKKVMQSMRGMPEYMRRRMRYFFEMHRRGQVFVPETDVRVLLNSYAWGAGRARHLAPVIQFLENKIISSDVLKGTPVREILKNFRDDLITGVKNREKAAVFSAISKASGGAIPYEFINEFAETMISNVYGATMGLRLWLVLRNLTQPWITTVLVTGPRALVKAYKDIGNRELRRDFMKQGIHMRRGGGLPFAEEIFKKLDAIPGKSTWKNARKILSLARQVNYGMTKPYQLADTLNRFVSYRAFMNRVEQGFASRSGKLAVARLSDKVNKELKKIPTTPVRGKVRLADIKKSRYRASRKISTSKQMDDMMKATGFNNAFMPSTVEFYKERLGMLLTGGEISKRALGVKAFGRGAKKAFIPLGYRDPRGVEKIVKEAFLGRTGKIQEAMELTLPSEEAVRKMIKEGFRDSFGKRASRQVVAETQWLYERKVQAPWIQKRWFGMFGTWSSNYIDFLVRHFKHIGTPADKIKKAALTGGVYGGLYAGLQYAGISPSYLYRSFMFPTGGPLFTSLMDAVGVIQPGVPAYEKEAKLKRLGRTVKETMPLIPLPVGQIKSMYQAGILPGQKKLDKPLEWYFGPAPWKKPPIQGVIGAPVRKGQLSEYQRTKQIAWNEAKLTPARIKAIRTLREQLQTFDLARKTHEDPDIKKLAEERYTELYWKLREVLEPVTMYVPGDPGLVADRVLEWAETKKKTK